MYLGIFTANLCERVHVSKVAHTQSEISTTRINLENLKPKICYPRRAEHFAGIRIVAGTLCGGAVTLWGTVW